MDFSLVILVTFSILFALGYISLMIYLIFFYSKGKAGENAVARRLKRLPTEEYKVINDLMLPTQYGTTQIDHVVVSRYGVFVIETKNYRGNIYGSKDASEWKQYTRYDVYSMINPIRQNDLHVKCVDKYLQNLGINSKLISIIVFTHRARVKVNQNVCDIVYTDELLLNILSYSDFQLSQEEVEQIYNKLLTENIISKEARREHIKRIKTKYR